jgi:hypothetical protein
MISLSLLSVIIVTLAIGASQAQTICTRHDDCPGHNSNLFCGSPFCNQGQCAPGVSPCAGECLEKEQRCVECLVNTDCPVVGYVCDPRTYTCHGCSSHADCPDGTWCTGGHWYCNQGKCYAPPASKMPCQDLDQCIESSQTCARCYKNEDCGTWDYCNNRVHCDLDKLECVKEAPLPDSCTYCDSRLQRCFECVSDGDCITSAFRSLQPFCSPPELMQVCEAGTCVTKPNTHVWVSPCANSAQECSEERKQCNTRLCIDGSDAACSDGNDCNGVERCNQQMCQPPLVTRCPTGMMCSPKDARTCVSNNLVSTKDVAVPTSTIAPSLTEQSCTKNSDCPNNWLCRITSRTTNQQRGCRPCRTDAQCIHNESPEGKHAVCNKTSGSCSVPWPAQSSSVITLSIPRPSTLPAIIAKSIPSSPSLRVSATSTADDDEDAPIDEITMWDIILGLLTIVFLALIAAAPFYIIHYNLDHISSDRGISYQTSRFEDDDDDTTLVGSNQGIILSMHSTVRSWLSRHFGARKHNAIALDSKKRTFKAQTKKSKHHR